MTKWVKIIANILFLPLKILFIVFIDAPSRCQMAIMESPKCVTCGRSFNEI